MKMRYCRGVSDHLVDKVCNLTQDSPVSWIHNLCVNSFEAFRVLTRYDGSMVDIFCAEWIVGVFGMLMPLRRHERLDLSAR